MIGANAVVLTDVPARSCVAGIPAKIIRSNIDLRDYRLKSDMQRYVPAPLEDEGGVARKAPTVFKRIPWGQ